MVHALRGSSPLPASDNMSAPRVLGASALGTGAQLEGRQTAAKAVVAAFDRDRAFPPATILAGISAVLGLRAAHADGVVANSLRAHFPSA